MKQVLKKVGVMLLAATVMVSFAPAAMAAESGNDEVQSVAASGVSNDDAAAVVLAEEADDAVTDGAINSDAAYEAADDAADQSGADEFVVSSDDIARAADQAVIADDEVQVDAGKLANTEDEDRMDADEAVTEENEAQADANGAKIENGNVATDDVTVVPDEPKAVVSTSSITGAPKSLKVVEGDSKDQVKITFTPNLTCGIDRYSSIVIVASTDGKKTWEYVDSWDFSSGFADINVNSYAAIDHVYATIDYGKTYYFKAYYLDSDAQKGPDSNIVGPYGPVLNEKQAAAALKTKIQRAAKSSGTVTGNKPGTLKVGTKATFNRGLYKQVVEVTKISGSKVTFKVKITGKSAYKDVLTYTGNGYYYKNKSGTKKYATTPYKASYNLTVDMKNYLIGANYITFNVCADGGSQYNLDGNKCYYFEKDKLYFNVAPQQPSVSLGDAKKSSLTFGKAYSTSKNVTSSGTIIKYRKKGSKTWKSKTFKKGSTIKITGLKSGTKYEVKLIRYIKCKDANGKTKTCKSKASSTGIFKTAYASAPKIKSVQVSNVSEGTSHHSGYWYWVGNTLKYRKPYVSTGTSYKITITLSSKPGNAAGVIIKDPNGNSRVLNGAKTTYTIDGSIAGHVKGQSRTIKIATFTNGSESSTQKGISPYASKTIVIK